MRSQAAMAKAMKGVSKAMSKMNSRMNLPQLQKIMMDFEREVGKRALCVAGLLPLKQVILEEEYKVK